MPLPPLDVEKIDPDALKVVQRLARNGYDAYLVGGCVRDVLLGRKPKDFDVATNATPNQIRALFRNCRIIGRRFRLAHIFFGSKIIETSTFRANPREDESTDDTDGDTEGGTVKNETLLIRHDNVFGSAEEDARRRDFTINGLFYDVDEAKTIDYVGGMEDLERQVVRTIGDPDIRFREDPVRILRAIKFAARLSFEIDHGSLRAILAHADEIAKCAAPRVLEEIYRLLRGGAARRSFELLEETGVINVLLPQMAAHIANHADGRAALMQTLEMLDEYVAEGATPSNALLAAILLSPMVRDLLGPPGPDDNEGEISNAIVERLAKFAADLRPSRRDSEISRQMILALRRMAAGKKRRGKPMSLVRRDWFAEALLLFEIVHPEASQAGSELAEEAARWRRLLRETETDRGQPAAANVEGAPATSPDGGPKRKRRRRGGRRRRKPPEAANTDV
jgi:poly(A) polymerase